MMKHRDLTKLEKIKNGYFSRKKQIWRDAMFHDVLLAGRVWNIAWFIGLICVALLYIFSIRRYIMVKLQYVLSLLFFFCLSLIYITMGSPLTAISHFSFILHMIQMSILYFIIPPIFLLGIPEPLFQQLGKIPIIKKAR